MHNSKMCLSAIVYRDALCEIAARIIEFQLWQDGKLLLWSIVGVWIIALISIIPVVFIFEYQIYISPADNRTIYFQWVNADDYFYYSIPSAFIGRPLIAISVFILYGNIFFTAFRKVSIKLSVYT